MGSESVLWAETPDDERDEADAEAHGALDESFAVRRLRRWLRGMFGGAPEPEDDSDKREPDA